MSRRLTEHDYRTVINHVYENSPKALLCGSVALMAAGLLDWRDTQDVDFVIKQKDFDRDNLDLMRDMYAGSEGDGYRSYHGNIRINEKWVTINFLVFFKEVELATETINFCENNIVVQKLDDILKWKQKYNRSKDIKDLDNIAKNLIERDCLQET